MGPATPAYLEAGDFTAVHAGADVESLPADHQDVRALLAAVEESDADESGLLPQWRARPEPSQRVARALGFRVLGAQISLRLSL